MEQLISYSNNLMKIFESEKDIVGLKHALNQSCSLQSQCRKDLNEVQNILQDYERKIGACKQKAAASESESAADEGLELLQTELQEELKLESFDNSVLMSTVIINEIDDLEHQRVSAEEQRQTIKKFRQDELRAQ